MVYKEVLPTPSIEAGKGVFTFYGEATIGAPAQRVYEALRDFESYSKWNKYTPTIKAPNGSNALAVDDMITLAYRPEPHGKTMDVPCRIISISDEDRSICWRGCVKSIPTSALLPEKVQTVTPQGENRCLYRIYETQAGPLAYAVKWTLGKKLSAMNQGIADGLKGYVEGGSTGGS